MSSPEGEPRLAWKEYQAELAAAGFRPSRRLGQNFLLDENMARAIARDARLAPGEFVLEVGVGCGFLTAPLLDLGARVLSVEIDGRLVELAGRHLAGRPGFELLHADALAGKHRLAPEVLERLPREGDWSLVANLPYGISAPLLAVLTELEHPPRSMQALVQSEMADRICAAPPSADWGPLAVRLQAAYTAERVREVSRTLFWPRPKVESAVVRLVRREDAPPREELRELCALAAGLFGHRRQTVARVLAGLLDSRPAAEEALRQAGIDPGARPQVLTLEALRRLAGGPAWAARRDRLPPAAGRKKRKNC